MKKASNELGYTFEVDEILTKYAQEKQPQYGGGYLPALDKNFVVLKITRHGEFQTFVLSDAYKNNILFDLGGFESAACKLDVIKLNEKFQK